MSTVLQYCTIIHHVSGPRTRLLRTENTDYHNHDPNQCTYQMLITVESQFFLRDDIMRRRHRTFFIQTINDCRLAIAKFSFSCFLIDYWWEKVKIWRGVANGLPGGILQYCSMTRRERNLCFFLVHRVLVSIKIEHDLPPRYNY